LTRRFGLIAVLLGILTAVPTAAFAQANAQRGRLIVTVLDPSGASVADANVTIVGLETATKAVTIPPAKTDAKGVRIFEGLVLGRYSIQAEFPGFELGLMRDIRVNRGDNKHGVILPLKGFTESVTVGQDRQEASSSRASLGSALTREQMESLSDDPDEMRRQLDELAGPNATLRVDSFEGSQLPPKAQIKSIHITRDQYAAENHYIGGLFIDIITQPGMGPIRTNVNMGFSGSVLNGRTEFTPVKGPEAQRNLGVGFGGTIIPRKLDASMNVGGSSNYATPSIYLNDGTGRRAETLNIKQPTQFVNFGGTLNYAVTPDQTIRVSANAGNSHNRNMGVGNYNLLERAYSTEGRNYGFMFQEAGPLGRRFFTNTRLRVNASNSRTESVIEAPTVIVNDAFTSGGAQQRGQTRTRSMTLQSDLDYVRGIHSWRTGIMIEGSWFRSDDTSNYLGTYTFTSLDAFKAGMPTFYSRRVGDPTIQYSNIQVGVYVQDDIRVSRSLTLSPGFRYEAQTHVTDYNGFAPRFGFTWSPFKSGKTSVRGGGGISYDWLGTGTYAQTVRLDGLHQLDLNITNPTYPDPGDVGIIRATNRYQLASEYVLPRNLSLVAAVSQQVLPRFNVNASFTHRRSTHVARGRNLNAPQNGARPDPNFLNVIETVSDAESRGHSLSVGGNVNIAPPGPATAAPRFNWKRMNVGVFYSFNRNRNNSDGVFSVPASGTLDTEWGPAQGSRDHSVNFNLNSNQIKNLNLGVSMSASSGNAYNITTGFDENGDLFFNDRPLGFGRNSARTPYWTQNWTARMSYSFLFGKPAANQQPGIMFQGGIGGITAVAAPPPTGRYRLSINVFATNLTNRSNYGGFSGVLTSPFYGLPTSSGEPRRIQVSLGFGF
jgi:hypothetical protein